MASKKFSNKVLETSFNIPTSIGMWKEVKKHQSNMSHYIRSLIMNDMQIDVHGNKLK